MSGGRAGQRRLERAHARCETLAGTHIAREHAIRRGHAGAIWRFERRIRPRATRAPDAIAASSFSSFFSERDGGQSTRPRAQPPGRRARRAVSPARACDSESAPRLRRAASVSLERAAEASETRAPASKTASVKRSAARERERARAARARDCARRRAREDGNGQEARRRARRTCGVVYARTRCVPGTAAATRESREYPSKQLRRNAQLCVENETVDFHRLPARGFLRAASSYLHLYESGEPASAPAGPPVAKPPPELPVDAAAGSLE